MDLNFRYHLLNLLYDTPLESFARKTYMFLFQKGNFYTDRQTVRVLRKVLHPTANCIDIGCYRGEILRHMVRFAPNGRIFAVEPCPYHLDFLTRKFPKVIFFPVALGDESGFGTFHFDCDYPARSGMLRGKENVPHTEKIQVRVEKLDALIPADIKIDLIKIDVEGAEYAVINGGRNVIKQSRPVIIFEHGPTASGPNGQGSAGLFDLICEDIGLHISTMERWLAGLPPLDKNAFIDSVVSSKCSDFIAF